VAAAIGQAAIDVRASAAAAPEPRRRLQDTAQAAILVAARRLRRHAWLDFASLGAILYAGIHAALSASATPFKAVSLFAATLLWLANRRSARHLATSIYAGATALVDSVVASFDEVEGFGGNAERKCAHSRW
jgi:hypothetical protein